MPRRSIVRATTRILLAALLPAALPAAAQSQSAPADTTVTIRAAGSALEFLPARLSLRQGIRVELRFTNDGSLPHNIVLVKDSTALEDLATEAYGAAATGFVPQGMKEKLVAASELVSPGQSAVLTFVVPPPGEYTFICLFPGHANMMVGTLRSLR